METETALKTLEALKRRMIVGGSPEYNRESCHVSPIGELIQFTGDAHSCSWSGLWILNVESPDPQEIKDFELLRAFFGGSLLG